MHVTGSRYYDMYAALVNDMYVTPVTFQSVRWDKMLILNIHIHMLQLFWRPSSCRLMLFRNNSSRVVEDKIKRTY